MPTEEPIAGLAALAAIRMIAFPPQPTPPTEAGPILEQVEAYQHEFSNWKEAVIALIAEEESKIAYWRRLRRYRRKHWPGW